MLEERFDTSAGPNGVNDLLGVLDSTALADHAVHERHGREKTMKSSVDEIRDRFEPDVERFSNLEIGQSATVDAPLAMALVAEAASAVTPHAKHILDIGCGAGNYTLKLLQHLPGSTPHGST